ncbi:family 10 glycosylhydrolase [Flavimarina sp. Hel_I_48]|uniref:family 10 glycosylhydrolase n=1 Tax=Flavimarina sp. Hel_I_48 TaxID=1392488 RepID=UPI0004DF4F16|nr:family 10 glycosylhydrolase [Flavimarina sp. Hel_I_48]
MQTKYFVLLLCSLLFFSCEDRKSESIAAEQQENAQRDSIADFKFWTWITADPKKADSAYTSEFKKYSENGIDAVLINTNTDAELLAHLTPLAKEQGLEVHAWLMTMNRPGDTVALKHPDWYQVSRSGKSSFDDRPYVDYYQWLSPSNPEAVQHIYNLIEGLAKVEGVASVHLDYIRYPDVYLPIGLLPKYDLKQEEELPDYDFDYSDASVNAFKEKYGKDPREMENPAIDIEWKQFRLNQVKNVVDHAYKIAHDNGKYLTAAVFPYPEMADHMVRQRWDKWDIDMVLPMIYNNFYNEGIDWIGFATQQGVNDLAEKNVELHTGLYIPEMTPQELKESIQIAKDNGAKGVAFFDGNALTDEKLQVIKEFKEAN